VEGSILVQFQRDRQFTKSIAPDYFGNWKCYIIKYGKDDELVRATVISTNYDTT